MNNTLIQIYSSADILVAFALGIWFIYTKGKLTTKSKPVHKFPVKWVKITGYIAILYGVAQTIRIFV